MGYFLAELTTFVNLSSYLGGPVLNWTDSPPVVWYLTYAHIGWSVLRWIDLPFASSLPILVGHHSAEFTYLLPLHFLSWWISTQLNWPTFFIFTSYLGGSALSWIDQPFASSLSILVDQHSAELTYLLYLHFLSWWVSTQLNWPTFCLFTSYLGGSALSWLDLPFVSSLLILVDQHSAELTYLLYLHFLSWWNSTQLNRPTFCIFTSYLGGSALSWIDLPISIPHISKYLVWSVLNWFGLHHFSSLNSLVVQYLIIIR